MQLAAKLFNRIARSHMYWGRKPLVGLLHVFEGVEKGRIVLDPFCGAGTPAIAALLRGRRVIATDLNPFATFLTRVLVRPLSIPGLNAAFNEVLEKVHTTIDAMYKHTCPRCNQDAVADFIQWEGTITNGRPVAAKIDCPRCGIVPLHKLTSEEERKQLRASQILPQSWFPETRICTIGRKPPVSNHSQLFTNRNLAALAELYAAIGRLDSMPYREALQYVFTASLYSCSQMQMFSEKEPSSSRGWTALRYYIPPLRKERNVLSAFTGRFATFISCKEELNAVLPAVRITEDPRAFRDGDAELLVNEMSWADSLQQFGSIADCVFLDPPYNIDIDYFGFSEFWGTWLKIDFDFILEWHARKDSEQTTRELLAQTARSTSQSALVDLALDPKDPERWEAEAAIKANGYSVKETGFFLYDNSYKRGGDLLRRRDRFYILQRSQASQLLETNLNRITQPQLSNADTYPYLRAMAHILAPAQPSPEALRSLTSAEILPVGLRFLCEKLGRDEIVPLRTGFPGNPAKNRKVYRSLCLALVNATLQQDGWRLGWVRKGAVEKDAFGLPTPIGGSAPRGVSAIAEFVSNDGKRKLFIFFPDQGAAQLRSSAQKIAKFDANTYNNIAILILPDRSAMAGWRLAKESNRWPRGFFISLDELRDRCFRTCPEVYSSICCPIISTLSSDSPKASISAFTAKIIENVQVGGKDAPYYKLRFTAPGLTGIVPGQFIMMDTMHRELTDGVKVVPWKEFKTSFQKAPKTYLKRPFGVHRAFYPEFQGDYLKQLFLPPSLASVMHTALPDTFDIFYKVLAHGKGTSEMRELREGMEVEMLGPLGSRFDIRKMINQGVKEVHVVGGGVGMAPLIFLVQALRFLGVHIKAFIGIESTSLLRYQSKLKPNPARGSHVDIEFAAGPEDAHIYIDDLKQAGVEVENIFVSYDKDSGEGELVPIGNRRQGLVSDLYSTHLIAHPPNGPVVAFACGPTPMMKAVFDVTKVHGVPLHVLMEKRMACGIGVCLSCVCKTHTSHSGYARVCKEGPIFDASEIIWKTND